MKPLVLVLLLAHAVLAQTGGLRGLVTDESGALVPGAAVTASGPQTRTAKAGADATYSLTGLPPGRYTVSAVSPGLAMRQPASVSIGNGVETANLVLYVFVAKQQVTVAENGGGTVSTEASNNAGAVVLAGQDLDALSDNLDDLAADLQALAGPAAGPNGGSIFIDGFSGGQLPPKESIREIRINQNPFSPEYDKIGLGRIEILTKPGADKFHGDLGYNFATDKWNSRNPYASVKAPFHLHEFRNSLSGPLGKRASFNLVLLRELVDNGNIVNAVTLDPASLVPREFTDTPISSLSRTVATPRVDYQLSPQHTLSLRYAFSRDDVANAGVGSFNLVSRGVRVDGRSHVVQATETAVLGAKAVNETRFQYFRPRMLSDSNTPGPAVQVLGAFAGGGNPLGRSTNAQDSLEFQNYTTLISGLHTWRFGVRVREASETSVSPLNFAGTFTFSGGLAPELDSFANPTGAQVNISSIESYRRTLLFQRLGYSAARIRQLGGGASQFTIATGTPAVDARQVDVAGFVGDDWRARPNLTVSYGLRYETQNNIGDRRDLAPRIGVAWAPWGSPKSKPKTVIRAGAGIFYDRFALGNTLTARRYNGVLQQQYILSNPDFFPNVPSLSGPIAAGTTQQVSGGLRSPYLVQTAAGVERELPHATTVAITYANTHGVHMLRSRNLNTGRLYLMESTGMYNQSQLILNVNTRVHRDVSLNGSYAFNRARSDTDGLSTFPANPDSMAGEYGPAATDVRHRVSLTGTLIAKWGIRLNPLLTANSGPPFDITAGHDLYGDGLFNGRPAIASDPNKPGVVRTAYGLLDPNPSPGDRLLPRNFGRGPGQIMLNLRIGKTFALGRKAEGVASLGGSPAGGASQNTSASPLGIGGGGPAATAKTSRRYNLTVSMQIRNVTNHNNPGPIIGNIASPLFGRANQPAGSGGGIFSESANNRRLEVQARLSF